MKEAAEGLGHPDSTLPHKECHGQLAPHARSWGIPNLRLASGYFRWTSLPHRPAPTVQDWCAASRASGQVMSSGCLFTHNSTDRWWQAILKRFVSNGQTKTATLCAPLSELLMLHPVNTGAHGWRESYKTGSSVQTSTFLRAPDSVVDGWTDVSMHEVLVVCNTFDL